MKRRRAAGDGSEAKDQPSGVETKDTSESIEPTLPDATAPGDQMQVETEAAIVAPVAPLSPARSLTNDAAAHASQLARPDSVETLPDSDNSEYQYYTGGYSQWREYEEDRWDEWDWPPRDWRPSEWHDCYWNKSSHWYRYNHKDWGAAFHSPPPNPNALQRSPCTSSLTPSLSSGSLEVQEVAGMLRSRTGDIVPMVVQPTEQEQVSGTADGSVENAHKNANEDNTSAKGGGNGTSQTEKTEGPGGGGETQNGKAEDSGSTKDPDQVPIDPELEKKKKAAHARYMRYYRSIRSHCLSQTFALCVSKHSS